MSKEEISTCPTGKSIMVKLVVPHIKLVVPSVRLYELHTPEEDASGKDEHIQLINKLSHSIG